MAKPYQHFKRLKQDVDVAPLLVELDSQSDAFDAQAGRQAKISVQRESRSIPLRGLRKSKINGRPRWDVQESRWTSSSKVFPGFCSLLREFAREQEARLGRAKIVLLPAGNQVYPHIDRGEYYRLHERYHLVLKSTLGSYLKAGEEEVRMQTGELWWFDNKQVHEAHNDGSDDRIHLIFDLLPEERVHEAFGSGGTATA